MTKSQYHCTQTALYQATKLICQSLKNNLESFSSFKEKYSTNYADSILLEMEQAQNLPHFYARFTDAAITHIHLINQLNACTYLWQALKRYIRDAFPRTEFKIHLQAAGSLHFRKATNKNWDEANALLTSATNFITLHQNQLTANKNMPSTFPQKFSEAHENFSILLLQFQQADKKIKENTNAKIQANNLLYQKLKNICADAKYIFKNNPALKAKFTFTTLITLISGTGHHSPKETPIA
ncbi:MAG: hypothetical protein NTX03_12865 [Bacteroidetes bacterium]|nr:hypothetical protein [Bacteroidota bacterium]